MAPELPSLGHHAHMERQHTTCEEKEHCVAVSITHIGFNVNLGESGSSSQCRVHYCFLI